MDGVLVHEDQALAGAADFVGALQEKGRPFLILTNNSIFTTRDLRARLAASGIEVPEQAIWTSALATAQFLVDQAPDGGSAYVIGEAGLTTALYQAGFTLTASRPDFSINGIAFESRAEAFRKSSRSAYRAPIASAMSAALDALFDPYCRMNRSPAASALPTWPRASLITTASRSISSAPLVFACSRAARSDHAAPSSYSPIRR